MALMIPLSPFAPEKFPTLPALAGVRLAATGCGLRYQGRSDLTLISLADGTTVSGVLTRSQTASAPVEWCRRHLPSGAAQAVVINAGNANAFTGRAGVEAVEKTATTAAQVCGIDPSAVLIASTGVIGTPLDSHKIVEALPGLGTDLGSSSAHWEQAARAIMTTDTFPKGATRQARIGTTTVTINGIAKGSGMIAPDMATMLAFIFTDAAIPAPILNQVLKPSCERSFNAISVDGDTSTSDTVLLFATGCGAAHRPVDQPHLLDDFSEKLYDLMRDLAIQIVRDGEGISKFVTIDITGAASWQAARRIGLSVASSPLVKTAIAGEDPNWGRLVMAVGKAGERADRDRLEIAIGGFPVASHGAAVADYDESLVAAYMKGREISIAIDVGVGSAAARVWTCDLSHGYIDINADYRS